MSKTLLTLFAAVLAGALLHGPARAADEPQDGKPAAAEATKADQEAYLAALKKCDAMSGDQKTKCVEAAKRKFGQM